MRSSWAEWFLKYSIESQIDKCSESNEREMQEHRSSSEEWNVSRATWDLGQNVQDKLNCQDILHRIRTDFIVRDDLYGGIAHKILENSYTL